MRPPPSRTPWWRSALASLGARNPRSARAWAAVALLATSVTCVGSSWFATGELRWPELLATGSLVALSAALLLLPVVVTAPLVVLAPLSGTATVLWLDLVSRDAGLTGRVFFTVPVIWAASQLRAGGTVVVTAATIAADAVVAATLLPREEAVTTFAYTTTLLVLVAGTLARGAWKQDRLVEQLRRQARTDPLTGLVTRRVLDAATERVAAAGSPAALVVIDIDRFKCVNDTYGHLGGDAALAHVAGLLAAHCRERDVVARTGGDELAVLMPDCPPAVAVERAERFVEAVREAPLVLPGGQLVPLSISAGLAAVPGDARAAHDLYASADSALYAATRAGRDRLARA